MINIKVNSDGKEMEVKCEVHIEGRKNALREFYAVLAELSKCNDNVLCDALDMLVTDKLGGDDDDESES